MKRQPWVALTATAAVLAIVGAACGTSEPSDAEPEATTTTVVAEEAAPEPSIVTPPHEDDLETLLEDLIAGTELPALGVTVFDSQGVIESGVTGVRRVGDPTLVALTDKFSIGSNAKAMTATLVATYVDDGEISWETTVGDVFGDVFTDLDDSLAQVTVRQLLNHTGGLNDELAFGPLLEEADWNSPLVEQRFAAAAITLTRPAHHPVGEYMYSNVGYTLIGAMLEEVTGTSWEDLIQSRLFDVLSMDSCGFYAPGTPGLVDQPWGHFTDLGGRAMDPGDPDAEYPHVLAPAGMVHCSMADWALFLQSQLRGFQGSDTENIKPEAFVALQTPAEGSDYALGWRTMQAPNGIVLNHHGGNDRFTSEVWLLPGADRGILVVTNLGEETADPTLRRALDAMSRRHSGTDADQAAEGSDAEAAGYNIETVVSDWVETENAVGVVAAVAAPGRAPAVATAGWSDREESKSISPTESFRIGSITKVFTAVLILDLVEDGLIRLQDPVADYVASADSGMTIAHLLSHTSGLPDLDVSGGVLGAIMDPSSVLTPGDVIKRALRHGVESEPGTHQSYSSTNYLILGDIVETATGKSYESALRARVLDPLGLEDTGFEQDDTDLATPYERPGPGQPKLSLNEFQTDVAVRASWAAGGLVSTVGDLVVFTEALFGEQILSSATIDLMIDTTTAPRTGYGLGVSSYPVANQTVYGHNGRSIGFAASLRHDPTTGITVVVLANDGTAPTAELAAKLIQAAVGSESPGGGATPGLEAMQIDGVWVFQHNPDGSNAALHSGTAEIVNGCLMVDNTIVVWHVDRIHDATHAIAAIKAGDAPQLLVGGGGVSIDEGASPDLIPTVITERCPTRAVWYESA